jgi:hypothetical protein
VFPTLPPTFEKFVATDTGVFTVADRACAFIVTIDAS